MTKRKSSETHPAVGNRPLRKLTEVPLFLSDVHCQFWSWWAAKRDCETSLRWLVCWSVLSDCCLKGSRAFLLILSTEGRGVRLWWSLSNATGPKAPWTSLVCCRSPAPATGAVRLQVIVVRTTGTETPSRLCTADSACRVWSCKPDWAEALKGARHGRRQAAGHRRKDHGN